MYNRQLVVCALQRHLTALKLPWRPVIFHANLCAAMDQLDKSTLIYGWDGKYGKLDWEVTVAASIVLCGATWDAWRVACAAAMQAGRAAREIAFYAALDTEALAADVRLHRLEMFRRSQLLDVIDTGVAWAAMMGITWDAWDAAGRDSVLSSADHLFFKAAQTFLEILHGGAFFLWTTPQAVHVVLATIRTQEGPPLHPGPDNVPENRLRLHCEDAPAIQYEDGSGLYFWRGVQVPERMILCPGEMRVEEILQERNVEVRRAMIERYGQTRSWTPALNK